MKYEQVSCVEAILRVQEETQECLDKAQLDTLRLIFGSDEVDNSCEFLASQGRLISS